MMMPKSHWESCSGQGALCYAVSPHGLIPLPIKRARTLVSFVVVIVASVKCVAVHA